MTTQKTLLLSAAFAVLAIFGTALNGCNSGGPSNEDELKKMTTQPSNNPDVGVVDGSNKEFGGGKPKGTGG